jgi:glycosyltransferase involved in cell wall biosynthesis
VAETLKVLFFSEGILGGGNMQGHATYDGALASALDGGIDGVEARFTGLGPMTHNQRRLALGFPVIGDSDLDLQMLRWHLVQAARTRSVLRRELASWSPDVVHVRSHSIAMGMLGEMRRLPVVPVVDASVWGHRQQAIWRKVRPWSRLVSRPSMALERQSLERAPLVLAMSEWAKEEALEDAPRARIVHHHPGLDLTRYSPAPRESREALRVLFVGANFGAKGGHDLLAALAPRLGRDVELDIVTPDEIDVPAGVRVHRLSSGEPALVALFQQADVFCHPTHADAIPWAVLEAMACGTPVVSTDVGAIPEMLGGEAGLVVPHGDVTALREALERLLGEEDLRRRLGTRGRALCEEKFDASRQVPVLIGLLREAVAIRELPRP